MVPLLLPYLWTAMLLCARMVACRTLIIVLCKHTESVNSMLRVKIAAVWHKPYLHAEGVSAATASVSLILKCFLSETVLAATNATVPWVRAQCLARRSTTCHLYMTRFLLNLYITFVTP